MTLTDDISTNKDVDADVHFMTRNTVEITENGVDILLRDKKRVSINCPDGRVSLEYHYNAPQDEEHFMSDKRVLDDGRCAECTRIVFTFDDKCKNRVIKTYISHN